MSNPIGQQLRQKREARSLTIDQAASATRIRAHYLTAMETGEFGLLPSPVHGRGFLRAYAEFLDLDAEPLLAQLEGKDPGTSTILPSAPSATAEKPEPIPLPKPNGSDRSSGTPGSSPDESSDDSSRDSSEIATQESAESIFNEVGRLLLRQRELLGLSLEDIERHTHLRQHYLQALEAGHLEELPSPVQARGMLNNYAAFLGMDPEPLLLRFADGLQARLQAKRAVQNETRFTTPRPERSSPAPVRRIFSTDMLIGGSVALFLIVFVVWGAIRIFTTVSTSAPTATAPSIADVLLATPTASETPTALPPSATAPPAQQLFPTFPVATGTITGTVIGPQEVGVQVYLTIRQRAWMRVTVDGKVEFDGRVTPGSAYPFVGGAQVEVLTGNGAAIQVFYNGEDVGVMGEFGQLIDQIYGPQGILAPTATVTRTPSPTSPQTATPARTSTPAPEAATAVPLP
jgi:cytoskeleton protein RodZ